MTSDDKQPRPNYGGYVYKGPFTLFQTPDGKWGTKDKDGNVYDRPVYIRRTTTGQENIFDSTDGLEVVDFDPKDGMSPIGWCSGTWIDESFFSARYPKEYNDFIMPSAMARRDMTPRDIDDIEEIKTLVELTALQRRVLDDIEFLCRWAAIEDDDERERMEAEWQKESNPDEIYPDDRVKALVPIMENPSVPGALKTTMWYGLFLFNSYSWR